MREELTSFLNSNVGHGLVREIYYVDEVSSTNTLAKQLALEGKSQGTLVVTNFQSQGQGRRGRTWVAPKGKDVFMSLLLRPQIEPTRAAMLTLVMGLSVAQALNELMEIESLIKWPNDIVVGDKKVCGILTEMSAQGENVEYVVIGTGINCNTVNFTSEAVKNATSLALFVGKEVERISIIAAVMQTFKKNYTAFTKTKDLTHLKNEYNRLLINKDREVRICNGEDSWRGTAHGINERGELLVVDESGDIQTIFTGEVSVRGLNGYV